ncbi:MAG: MATE family efflux transporter [Eubacterium sp.]|nr:MATE family efflux transporter [Eubacterium sp.]
METNMTQGRPLVIILRFMLPVFLGNVFQQFYNMVDTIIVGKFVGTRALAGVGSTGTIMFLVMGTCIGMATGFSVLTSQKFGAGLEDETRRSVANGILLSAIVVIVTTTVSLAIMHRVLHLMNTPDDIYQDAYNYISTICKGIVATVFYNLFSSYLRAIGNSRVPLYFLIFSSLLNIVLDLLFIVNFKMGTAGAAWATNISQGISAILCLIFIMSRVPVLRPRKEHWRFHPEDSRNQLETGIPMALQYAITASGTMIMQSAINTFGSTAVAAFTAASKSQTLLNQGLLSTGQTMASYAGQNYGYGAIDRVEQGTRDAMKFIVVYSITAAVISLLLLTPMLRLFFTADVNMADILPWARTYVTECVICYIPLGMIFVYRNTMQGCGYSFHAMTMGIVELLARLVAAAASIRLALYPLAVGADPLAWITGGIYGYIMYKHVMRKIYQRGDYRKAAD